MGWWVYIIQCKDNTLYTGCTNNLFQRFQAHSEGRGAKYTRGRAPLELVYTEECANRSAALIREAMVKKCSKKEKIQLILSGTPIKIGLPNKN